MMAASISDSDLLLAEGDCGLAGVRELLISTTSTVWAEAGKVTCKMQSIRMKLARKTVDSAKFLAFVFKRTITFPETWPKQTH